MNAPIEWKRRRMPKCSPASRTKLAQDIAAGRYGDVRWYHAGDTVIAVAKFGPYVELLDCRIVRTAMVRRP